MSKGRRLDEDYYTTPEPIKPIYEPALVTKEEMYKREAEIIRKAKIEELQAILNNNSGGGSWRRVIHQRLEELGGGDE